MSYTQHEYRPYPVGSEYAGTCKACARREEDHDLTPDELLVRTLKKGIENASPAALALNAEIAYRRDIDAIHGVQTPVTETDPFGSAAVWLTKERFDLGKAVIDAAIKLSEYGLTPTTPDGVEGSDRFICMYCNELLGSAPHKDDCLWLVFVLAVGAYES